MAKGAYHVVSRADGKWSVRKTGEGRASKVFDRRSEAIAFGRSVAKGKSGELIVHGRDGRVREVNTYASDPLPPRDKR